MRVRAIRNIVTEVLDDGELLPLEKPTYLPITIGNVYRVIQLSPEFYGIIDDMGFVGFYETHWFEVADPSEPADWITYDWSPPGQRFAGPACFSKRSFFTDLEYDDKEARRTFQRRILQWFDGTD